MIRPHRAVAWQRSLAAWPAVESGALFRALYRADDGGPGPVDTAAAAFVLDNRPGLDEAGVEATDGGRGLVARIRVTRDMDDLSVVPVRLDDGARAYTLEDFDPVEGGGSLIDFLPGGPLVTSALNSGAVEAALDPVEQTVRVTTTTARKTAEKVGKTAEQTAERVSPFLRPGVLIAVAAIAFLLTGAGQQVVKAGLEAVE